MPIPITIPGEQTSTQYGKGSLRKQDSSQCNFANASPCLKYLATHVAFRIRFFLSNTCISSTFLLIFLLRNISVPLPPNNTVSYAPIMLNSLQLLKTIVIFHFLILEYATLPGLLTFSTPAYLSRSLQIILTSLKSVLKFLPTPSLLRYLLFIYIHSSIALPIDSLVHSLTIDIFFHI